MRLGFAESAQSTVGIEWELGLVDAATGQLRNVGDDILAKLDEPSDEPFQVVGEFMLNTLELVTGVCGSVEEGLDQLAGAGNQLLDVLVDKELSIFSQGTHPFAIALDERISSASRYQKMLDRTQYWGQQMLIYGLHTHVGLDHVAKAMPAVNQLIQYYPHLLALSASSPFWGGYDTGYVSQRTLVFQQLPTSGLPFQFHNWADYEAVVADLLHVGVVDDVSEVRWDIRPVPRFGTVEQRVCDGVSTLQQVGAITALTQCLVHEAVGSDADAVTNVDNLPPWYVQENKWRAARYGLEAIVIIDSAGTELLVTDHLHRVLNRLEPVAAELGCARELSWVADMIKMGTAATRQRDKVGSTFGTKVDHDTLADLVLHSASETSESIRSWK
ncbi:glutamate--cysteine ligase [Yaniella flava]|uniref:Putative glutamate--cysteine ligase 2 n=1 Tax=Yaniella flava TaxID=287930 RepID=A0ABP5FMV6_9MICC